MKKSLLTTTQLIEGKFPKYVKDSNTEYQEKQKVMKFTSKQMEQEKKILP